MHFVSRLVMFLVLLDMGIPSARAADERMLAYDHVKSTGVIRCGYLIYAPFITKDINTGKLGGLTVEMMDAIGGELGYKIEWTEEVSMTTAFEAMGTGRYDVACIPFWITAPRVKVSEPTVPLYYDGYFAAVRRDDTRFGSEGYQRVNADDITISVQEGAAIQSMIPHYFPKAKVIEQMAITDPALQLQDVMAKKADVAFVEMSLFRSFEKNNPDKLKIMTGDPLMVMPAALWVSGGDLKMKSLLDNTILILQSKGVMASLLDKYGGREIFSYVRQPYDPVVSKTK